MILEVAILDVRPGETENFEPDFRKAQALVAEIPGYQKHELRRCVEDANRYLLNIWWDTLEAHTEGFRGSPQYEQWRELLHHYYDPFPVVEHYESVP
jgi:heme-degrading monooxygenase HmoA